MTCSTSELFYLFKLVEHHLSSISNYPSLLFIIYYLVKILQLTSFEVSSSCNKFTTPQIYTPIYKTSKNIIFSHNTDRYPVLSVVSPFFLVMIDENFSIRTFYVKKGLSLLLSRQGKQIFHFCSFLRTNLHKALRTFWILSHFVHFSPYKLT